MRHGPTFVDTNILLYAYDPRESEKRAKAVAAIQGSASRMMVSTQVLQEFYWIGMRKLGMEAPLARRAVQELSEGQVVVADRAIIAEAIDLSIVTGYTLWDALIIQAAVVGKCERLFTEDLQHGQIVKGVRIENPLLA